LPPTPVRPPVSDSNAPIKKKPRKRAILDFSSAQKLQYDEIDSPPKKKIKRKTSAKKPKYDENDDEEEEPGKLVSQKESMIEEYLDSIFATLEKPDNVSGVQLARIWKQEVRERIYKDSKTLSFKSLPLVQHILDQKMDELFEKSYGTLEERKIDAREMSEKYTFYFNKWIDCDTHVSFKTAKPTLLGGIHIKDAWILTFFAFLTCKRNKDDNMLMLGLVGASSSGKTTLFESVLMEDAHVATSEHGVGRYSVGKKPLLLFHDIDIRTLVYGKDVDKIKAIARTETCVAKVHSTTITLPSLFLFYSSNDRLMTHEFRLTTMARNMMNVRHYHTQIHRPGARKIREEDLVAVQSRFIECFVRAVPPINLDELARMAGFQRLHGIFGLFPRIIATLEHYKPEDFRTPFLCLYALKGLCVFASRYNQVMNTNIKDKVAELVYKMASPELVEKILQDMDEL